MGYDDFDGFDDYEDRSAGNSPADLRKAYNQLKKELKEKADALEKATSQIAQRNLKDVLAEKGLRPGLARVIAKEDVDLTDSSAVEAWLSDPANQEDFAFSVGSAGDTPSGGGTNDGPEGADEASEYAANLAQFQNAGNGALPAANAAVEQARSQIKGATTTAELNAALDAARKQLAS